jgi:hypothetical protein
MTDNPFDALRRALRGLAAPEQPPELLERILQSRAAGVRVSLPRAGRRAARWIWGSLAAAAALAIVISTRDDGRAPPDTGSPYSDIAATLPFWPPDALAQDAGPPHAPRYEPVRLEVGRAHAGTWTYRTCTIFDEGQPMCRGRFTIMVREAKWHGRFTWLVSRRQETVRDGARSTVRTPLDTAYFARATLRPIYAAMGGDHFRLVRWFSGDSVREALDIGGAHPRRWRAAAQIPGARDAPVVLRWSYWVDLAPLLQVLPLERGWRGSVYAVRLVGPDSGKAPFVPLDLRVVGSGRIEVPAGRFDCWKVEVREGNETERLLTLWVSKDRGWLVKEGKRGTDGRSETALLSATPPTP